MLRVRGVAAVLALLMAVAGCQADDPTTDPSPSPAATTPSPGPTAPPRSPSPTPTESPAVALADVEVAWEEVGRGFTAAVQVLEDPRDGTVLVVEQEGRVRTLAGDTVLDLRDHVTSGGERGLLAVAFHPDGERLYVHYSGDDGHTVLAWLPVTEDEIGPSETVVFETDQPARNHNGGALLFDPEGALVLGLGDGGGAGDPFDQGQDQNTVLGTLLRFDVDDNPSRARPHPDNPFLDGPAPEVWVYGLRNPWRVDFDDTWLWIADVGQNAVEEINAVERAGVAGANFGWPILEGSRCYRVDPCDPDGTVLPVAEHTHDEGVCSIIGGVVVPSGLLDDLVGAYVYSDLCLPRLWAVRMGPDGAESAELSGGSIEGRPLGFGAGTGGEVWVATQEGRILQLQPA